MFLKHDIYLNQICTIPYLICYDFLFKIIIAGQSLTEI